MQYRTIPKTGEKLSILGYGCMRLPAKAGRIDKETALRQIRTAIDDGVNYLDTAWPYHLGASESFLGDYVLQDGYREKVNIATKLPPFLVNSRDDMDKILTKQLRKLRTDHIDYYLLHGIEGNSWKKLLNLGIIESMERWKSEGMIRNMGFSFHGTREDFYTIIDGYGWEFCQVQYNLLDEHYQAGIEGINYAAERKIGVIVMEPLRGGQLVGKIPQEVQTIWDTAPERRSPAEWALRWIWNNPDIQVILSGMNKDEHIRENIRAASEAQPDSFSETELDMIDRVRNTYRNLLKIGCTGCRYCLPCPAEIDIPYAFQSYNRAHMFGKMGARAMYIQATALYSDKPVWTSACIDCGKCEKACPQQIPVRSELKKVRRELEGPLIKVLAAAVRPFINRKKKSGAARD